MEKSFYRKTRSFILNLLQMTFRYFKVIGIDASDALIFEHLRRTEKL